MKKFNYKRKIEMDLCLDLQGHYSIYTDNHTFVSNIIMKENERFEELSWEEYMYESNFSKRIIKENEIKLEYWGKKIERYYTTRDKDFGEVKIKVVEYLDDEGKQKTATRIIPTVDLSGSPIHQEICKRIYKKGEVIEKL